MVLDSYSVVRSLTVGGKEYRYVSLPALGERLGVSLQRLPISLRLLLENLLRHEDGVHVTKEDIEALARVELTQTPTNEIAFFPARVVLQDFTGVPAVVDLAAMRDTLAELGGDPERIQPVLPAELVIDHSIQVDYYGSPAALGKNQEREYERNRERYLLLKWAQGALRGFTVVPPGTGIVHQVNVETLARVVFEKDGFLYPDTVVGTDSHTTMINGLGVLGWGVGGIEAEAAMLGQPINFLLPQVLGVRVCGAIRPGVTATDVVLWLTQLLRREKVVGKFVEFFGSGLPQLSLADRSTIANMGPEFGCTAALFPIDAQTLAYLRQTGRSEHQLELIEGFARAEGLFVDGDTPEPTFERVLELDLGAVVPGVAGPRRPHDWVPLGGVRAVFAEALTGMLAGQKVTSAPDASIDIEVNSRPITLRHGSIVIAAITSCTNTSNPALMVAAGLLAKRARERGLLSQPWVKTSLAPGSRVVTRYLERAGLLEPLMELGFHVVGYGCTTCIGNSGPLEPSISRAISEHGLIAVSVLSGNRNFEGRISPDARANFLMSPPLVVASALLGRIDVDLETEPLGFDREGRPVLLAEIWPTPEEIRDVVAACVTPELYASEYGSGMPGDATWRSLPVPSGARFSWDPSSTYVRRPTFLDGVAPEASPHRDLGAMRALLVLGDFVTTDHISPAGSIAKDSPAARYLTECGVPFAAFNSYGARRGNHEVMVRGTFANLRLRNLLVSGTEGGFTRHFPSNERMSVFDASLRYAAEKTPLLVIAGQLYGSGSSRDWAAKGTNMLGVKVVLAQSFERIHRSNLIGMGILPLEFLPGESRESHGITGEELFSIPESSRRLAAQGLLELVVTTTTGESRSLTVRVRIDTSAELTVYRGGGLLPSVVRQFLAGRG